MALSANLRAFQTVPTDIRQWSNWLKNAITDAITGSVSTSLIDDNAVTFAKMQQVATDTVLGRATAGTGNVEALTCTAAGRALIDDADAATQRATLGLVSSTYLPTLTNVTNVAASTAYTCQYIQVGTNVTVSGRVDVDPTAAGATELGVSLPVASNFANNDECAGAAFASGIAGFGAAVLADPANNRARLQWVAVDITNQPLYFTYTYRIL